MNTELLIATFNENISYIEKQQPELFSKLVALDNAVANGHYQEKYELVFDNGYFDVLEKQTNNYLYGQNSDEYATLAARSIDYNLEENLFICSPEHKIDDASLKYYKELPLLEDYLSGMAPILHFIGERIDEKKPLKTLEKFIFFGVGLGLHIASIDKKIGAKQYLIVEDDLELFRLSLFTSSYSELSKKAQLYFAIFDDNVEFTETGEKFLSERYEENHYIKYFEMLSHSQEKREAFHLCVTNQAHLRFSYAEMLKQTLLPLENLFSEYQFLERNITLKETLFEEKPFLLVAAGPSLEKNIELLKEKAKSFVIVAVSATLPLLEKLEITPHIVVHLDAFEASIKHFDALESLDFLKDTLCLFSAKTSPLILKRLESKNIFLYEESTSYKENSFRPVSPCVGSLSYQILLYLKVKNIYLLGVDLAVDAQTGQTHSSSHIFAKSLDISDVKSDKRTIEYKKHLLSVEGNRVSSVFTTPHFKTSIDMMNYNTLKVKENIQTIKNFGDGAKFDKVEVAQLIEWDGDTLEENLHKDLQVIFSQYSRSGLSERERKTLELRVEYAQGIRERLFSYMSLEADTVDAFKHNLKQLVEDISRDDSMELSKVFYLYFRYLLPYIFDFVNREDVNISQKELRSINRVMVEHLMQLS